MKETTGEVELLAKKFKFKWFLFDKTLFKNKLFIKVFCILAYYWHFLIKHRNIVKCNMFLKNVK